MLPFDLGKLLGDVEIISSEQRRKPFEAHRICCRNGMGVLVGSVESPTTGLAHSKFQNNFIGVQINNEESFPT